MKTSCFISGLKKLLFADQYEDSRGQGHDSRQHRGDGKGEQHHQSDDEKVDGQQQHSDVFIEVHGSSILLTTPG
jgi:hypothetical protein